MKQANALRPRFYIELVVSLAALFLALVTVMWNDWIEIVFKLDPDMGNGSLEKAILAVLVLAAVATAWLARTEWRQAREAELAWARRR
jgi:hypothetical protein